jgi:hypothetical protein
MDQRRSFAGGIEITPGRARHEPPADYRRRIPAEGSGAKMRSTGIPERHPEKLY